MPLTDTTDLIPLEDIPGLNLQDAVFRYDATKEELAEILHCLPKPIADEKQMLKDIDRSVIYIDGELFFESTQDTNEFLDKTDILPALQEISSKLHNAPLTHPIIALQGELGGNSSSKFSWKTLYEKLNPCDFLPQVIWLLFKKKISGKMTLSPQLENYLKENFHQGGFSYQAGSSVIENYLFLGIFLAHTKNGNKIYFYPKNDKLHFIERHSFSLLNPTSSNQTESPVIEVIGCRTLTSPPSSLLTLTILGRQPMAKRAFFTDPGNRSKPLFFHPAYSVKTPLLRLLLDIASEKISIGWEQRELTGLRRYLLQLYSFEETNSETDQERAGDSTHLETQICELKALAKKLLDGMCVLLEIPQFDEPSISPTCVARVVQQSQKKRTELIVALLENYRISVKNKEIVRLKQQQDRYNKHSFHSSKEIAAFLARSKKLNVFEQDKLPDQDREKLLSFLYSTNGENPALLFFNTFSQQENKKSVEQIRELNASIAKLGKLNKDLVALLDQQNTIQSLYQHLPLAELDITLFRHIAKGKFKNSLQDAAEKLLVKGYSIQKRTDTYKLTMNNATQVTCELDLFVHKVGGIESTDPLARIHVTQTCSLTSDDVPYYSPAEAKIEYLHASVRHCFKHQPIVGLQCFGARPKIPISLFNGAKSPEKATLAQTFFKPEYTVRQWENELRANPDAKEDIQKALGAFTR